MAFKDLKKNSQTNLQKLTEKLEQESKPQSSADPRFWRIKMDKKTEVGTAVIRFLPEPAGEDVPWVKAYRYEFQGPSGDYYSEFSRATINESDPVADLNRYLWKNGDEDTARSRKRKTVYYSNIYVVKDPANPENEGKVFLFKYGQKIFEKINAQMHPEFEDETPVNPFDLWAGANFRMKVVMKGGFWNYDASKFDDPGVLGGMSDEELEAIYNQEHSLQELISGDNIKSYDELQARLDRVLRKPSSVGTSSFARVDNETDELESALGMNTEDTDDESDNLSYFARLAEMSGK